MRENETEEVSTFVQFYCAIPADEEDPPKGYFAFCAGRTSRDAKKARANIAWGEVTKTTAEVLRRVREIASSGSGHVWVRAFRDGESHFLEQVKVQGTFDEPEDDRNLPDVGSGAVGAMAMSLIRTNSQLLDENRDLRSKLSAHHEKAVQMTEEFTLAVIHGKLLEDSQGAGQMEAALSALAPTLEAVAPAIVAWVAGQSAQLAGDTADAKVADGARKMVVMSRQVGEILSANPLLMKQHPGLLLPLRELVAGIAPHVGMVAVIDEGGV